MKIRNDSDGILFFDKRSGINILLDEIQPTNIDVSPRHVSIALTNKCNFLCPHCYITHGNNELELSTVIKWIDQLDANGCLSIGLGGGEPTLWPDLLKLLAHISKTRMAITLTTNGSSSVFYYTELLQYLNLLRFSVDGLYDVYESNRGQSFEFLNAKIHELSKLGKIGLNYLLTDETVTQLDEFRKYINDIRPHEILLIPCLNKDGEVLLSEDSRRIFNDWLNANTNKLPIALSYGGLGVVSSDILPTQNFSRAVQDRYFLHITSRGELTDNVFSFEKTPINDNIIETIKQKRKMS